jgi:hypothetical protein
MTKTMLILLPRRNATGTVDGDKARKDTIPDRLGYFLQRVMVLSERWRGGHRV